MLLIRNVAISVLLSLPMASLVAQEDPAVSAAPADNVQEVTEAPPAAPPSQIYKSRDSEGRVIFSDVPGSSGAETVYLPPANTMPAPTLLPPSAADDDASDGVGYKKFLISSPKQDETIGHEVQVLTVTVEVNPPLTDGHKLQYYFDGQPLGMKTRETSRSLGELERGTHTLEVKLLDANGEPLQTTGTTTFHVKRHSILHRKNQDKPPKPAPTPPPKPAPAPSPAPAPK